MLLGTRSLVKDGTGGGSQLDRINSTGLCEVGPDTSKDVTTNWSVGQVNKHDVNVCGKGLYHAPEPSMSDENHCVGFGDTIEGASNVPLQKDGAEVFHAETQA